VHGRAIRDILITRRKKMKTMLDKCAVAGDITQAIDRRGAWSCAITVIGGTESTAVKLQSCETAGGTFEDFKTLIPSAEASASQYKGFVVDISGAGNFIKVVGATMATCVLGDCDADVKNVAIKAGEIPSGADLEGNKTATINVSTYIKPVGIYPTAGKDGMKKATVTLSNIPSRKLYAWQTSGETVYLGYTATNTPTTSDTFYLATSDGLVEKAIEDVTGLVVSVEIETTESFGRYHAGDIEL
jgi:hypothetical protein